MPDPTVGNQTTLACASVFSRLADCCRRCGAWAPTTHRHCVRAGSGAPGVQDCKTGRVLHGLAEPVRGEVGRGVGTVCVMFS